MKMQKEIEELEEPEWLITDRNDLPEYSDYGDNADRIRNIGQVFLLFSFGGGAYQSYNHDENGGGSENPDRNFKGTRLQ